MTRRLFSKPPAIGGKAKAPEKSRIDGGVSEKVLRFKATYVFERRMLERFRSGKTELYNPAPSLDGKSMWDTPEVKPTKNAWVDVYDRLTTACPKVDPITYVRILFKVLRGSALPVPTVAQLPSHNMLTLVEEFLKDFVVDIREQFVAQSQRAQSAIAINSRVSKNPLGLAVYCAILDEQSGLSPLFKYCLATETARQLKSANQQTDWVQKLRQLAKEYELPAAMEYTLFPSDYDSVWGSAIPTDFAHKASRLLKAAMVN